MRTKQRYGRIGTVSAGTMRAEDLIPAFLDVADGLRMSKADRKVVREIRANMDRLGDAYFDMDADGTQDETVDPNSDLEELFIILGNYAPPFAYFGAIEGDGSDYGFWPALDSLDEAVRDGEVWDADSRSETRPRVPKDCAFYRVVSDHGNVTLYYRNGREVWGVV